MSEGIRKLAAEFLRDYASRLGNDGCNDYDWPTWFSKHDRRTLINAYAADDPNAYEDENDKLIGEIYGIPNFIVASSLADEIERQPQ